MSAPALEQRSFEPRGLEGSDRDMAAEQSWSESTSSWDAVSSRALIHRVRWHTGLSQNDFADIYGIDLDHLKALERGAVLPDRALVAYLTVIDRAPETVRRALRTC
jgi:putative transcriptional regulator